jgi:hypothetical protein
LDKNDSAVIDPIAVATKKVLLGDAGDAVPGVVSWLVPDKNDPNEMIIRSLTDGKMTKEEFAKKWRSKK